MVTVGRGREKEGVFPLRDTHTPGGVGERARWEFLLIFPLGIEVNSRLSTWPVFWRHGPKAVVTGRPSPFFFFYPPHDVNPLVGGRKGLIHTWQTAPTGRFCRIFTLFLAEFDRGSRIWYWLKGVSGNP